MRLFSRPAFVALLLLLFPVLLPAQSDICLPSPPSLSKDSSSAFMDVHLSTRASLDMMRADWTANIVPVKFATTPTSLQPLCIFGIEVVPHPVLKLVAFRAPKGLMPAIEEAIKRLDVPQPQPRSVEITAYVLVVSELSDPRFMPIPAELQSVANQLKSILPKGTPYLLDTMVARGVDGQNIAVNQNAVFNRAADISGMTAQLNVQEGATPIVRLNRLHAHAGNATFETSLDLPVGTQAIVGKGTSWDAQKRTVVLVLSAKLLN